MKKHISLFLALILLVSAASVFSAAANTEDPNKSYNLFKTTTAPVVDGTAEDLWEKYPKSEDLKWVWTNGNYSNNNLVANFKAVWMEDSEDPSMINLYLLVQYTGYYNYPTISGIRVFLVNGDKTVSKTDVLRKNGMKTGTVSDYTHWREGTYVSAVTEVNSTVTFEFTCRVKKSENLKFDVIVQDGNSWSTLADYSWNGCSSGDTTKQVAAGALNLMQEISDVDGRADVILDIDGTDVASLSRGADNTVTLPNYSIVGGNLIGWKDASGKIYPINGAYAVTGGNQIRLSGVILKNTDYFLLDGASILIEEPTAMRFEVLDAQTEIMNSIAALVQEKGLLLVETSKLTDAILADGSFSAAELDAAQIPYEKTVLTAAQNNIHYIVKNNISDLTVSYSACVYITLKYSDNSIATVNLAYSALNNARSVKDVATAAYADRQTVPAQLTDSISYKFKVGKDFGVGQYIVLSFSPYTKEQLTLLDGFRK